MSDENRLEISFENIQEKWDSLVRKYEDSGNWINAFGDAYSSNPFVQNTRLKEIKSKSSQYTREQLERMFKNMSNSEQSLRQASHYFNNTIEPINKLTNMYADILSYRNYINTVKVVNKDILEKEYEIVARKKKNFDIKRTFRDITYQSIIEGKRFYYFREEGDIATFQQMPSDYMKIVHRYEGGWQCAINMMYFTKAGVSVDWFAPEFKDYVNEFFNVYDSSNNKMRNSALNVEDVEIYKSNRNWYFWKYLPVDRCYAFGLNDCEPEVVPTLSAMFLDANELNSYKMLEQELLAIPLKSIMTASVPFAKEGKSGNFNNSTAITPDLIQLYQNIIQQILPNSVDFIAAPFDKFDVHTFESVASKDSIVGNAMMNFYNQSAVSGIISTTSKPNVSQVTTTQTIESAFVDKIYSQFNYFLRQWVKTMNLKNKFEIIVEGDRFSDPKKLESVEKALATGNNNLYPLYLSFFNQDLNTAKGNQKVVSIFNIYENMQPLVSSFQTSDKGGTDGAGRPTKNAEDMSNPASAENGANLNRQAVFSNVMNGASEEDIQFIINYIKDNGYEVGDEVE